MKAIAPSFASQGIRGRRLSFFFNWQTGSKRKITASSRAMAKFYRLFGLWMKFLVPLIVIGGVFYYLVVFRSESTGSIRIVTDVPGAEILLDGSPIGCVTDTTLSKIPVGKVTVSVRKSGYRSNPPFATIHISTGKIKQIKFQMEEEYLLAFYDGVEVREKSMSVPAQMYQALPRPERKRTMPIPMEKPKRIERLNLTRQIMGSIIVSANEKDCEIFMNGQSTGRATNATLSEVPQGMYSISVVKEGYVVDPPIVDVSIERDLQSELVVFDVRPEREVPSLHLKVTTEPMAGQIFINGRAVGSGFFEKDMEPGKYLVAFGSVPAYFDPAPQEVVLSEDNPVAEIVGSYVKARGNAKLAVVRPTQNGIIEGSKLKVTVDNDPYFISPGGEHNCVLLDNLVAGNHRIQIDYDGKSESIDVTLVDNSIATINFRIERFLNFRSLKLRFDGMKSVLDWQKYSEKLNVLAVE